MNADKTYYRYTWRKDTPMSDWGHAMFSDTFDRVEGPHMWIFRPTENTMHINDLMDGIKDAWTDELNKYADLGYYSHCDGDDIEYWLRGGFDADAISALFNPVDIVDSAGAWDSELMVWFYNRIADPHGLDAIITDDGAIVWNETVITKDEEPGW